MSAVYRCRPAAPLVIFRHMRVVAAIVLAFMSSALQAQEPPADSASRPRRRPVTKEDERTAFSDLRARELFERARVARLTQDSALRAYDAKTVLRMSVGLGIRRLGPQRLLFRGEQAARVRWVRGSGAWVEPTGRRAVFPMGQASVDFTEATPIPYFPGRESLWLPSSDMGVAQAEVDENELIHPLAGGAEAYYRYATGDSMSFRLPDGRVVALRELQITARRPEWRAFVGSFWFDVGTGGLVRAAYRMAVDIDLWAEAGEDAKRQIRELEEKARSDTGTVAEQARKEMERLAGDQRGIRIASTIFTPARAKLSAVTVEYGLYNGRFWLPRLNVAEGEFVGGFLRVPMKWEESYRYNSVNGADSVPPVPLPGTAGLAPGDTIWAEGGDIMIGTSRGRSIDTSETARLAREDSAVVRWRARADTLLRRADSVAAEGDTAQARSLRGRAAWYAARERQLLRRREGCVNDTTYFAGITSRYDGRVRMAIRLPCNPATMANSPDLPGSIYEPGEELFDVSEHDALLEKLTLGLQPGWGPQRPAFHTGLDLLRYNKVEGLSAGASLTSQLGLGYTARLVGRIGLGDHVPNGELWLARSNGRSELRLVVFHRLAVANDDWGSPLSFGASVSNLIDGAADDAFYYRAYGAELRGSHDAPGPVGGVAMIWRLFAERHRSAGTQPNTQASLGNLFGDSRFGENIEALSLTSLGAAADFARSFGVNPRGFRVDTRFRLEGAFMPEATLEDDFYGRAVLDNTLTRPFAGFSLSLTGAGGWSVGSLPIQRAFHVGGLHTVRGQLARLGEGRSGDAFWLGRAELGRASMAFRPMVFYDAGWAGPRQDIGGGYRPMSGAGFGLSFLDGFVRMDLSRGIHPDRIWRFDAYLGARF
jgi:hypothetical protein